MVYLNAYIIWCTRLSSQKPQASLKLGREATAETLKLEAARLR